MPWVQVQGLGLRFRVQGIVVRVQDLGPVVPPSVPRVKHEVGINPFLSKRLNATAVGLLGLSYSSGVYIISQNKGELAIKDTRLGYTPPTQMHTAGSYGSSR